MTPVAPVAPVAPDSEELAIKSKVERRWYRRVVVLQLWDKEGVPPEYILQLPDSVRGLAAWSEPRLRIEAIPSPNDAGLNHPTWGGRVIRAKNLLDSVLSKLATPHIKKNSVAQANDLREEVRELKTMLRRVVEQWHEQREKASQAVDDAQYHKQFHEDQTQQIVALNEQIAIRDRELAEVRRDLAKLQSSSIRLHRP